MSAPQRKLTTIFSADVQDYSRLMGADEEATLAALKQCRAAMTRSIEGRGGRVINTWGDGLIAEFASVVEAVRAAVDAQSELREYNAGLPEARRMAFRIGVNLGDVMIDGADVYGDGVNVAARLQAAAPPGGVVISSAVYDHVRNKVAVGFDYLGRLSLKNIEGGVTGYAVRIGEESGARAAPAPDAEWDLGPPAPEPARGRAEAPRGTAPERRTPIPFAGLGLAACIVVAVNLLSWSGVFWAKWPLLGISIAAAMLWLRRRAGRRA